MPARTAAPVACRTIDAGDGLELHIALGGEGPPLVLLHGFTGSVNTWAPLRAWLERSHRVVAIDLPGHGLSSAPVTPERYGLERFADDLVRVLDALAIERTALLGYSMGGRAALRFARRHPGRLTALVLESTSPGIADAAARASRVRADEALADAIERDGVQAFVERWERLPLWDSQHSLPAEVRASLHAQRESNAPRGLANSLRGAGAGADLPMIGHLAEIAVPTLLIAGALDAAYVGHGRQMELELPRARLVVVPDAGHTVHLERPELFAAEVSAFLEEMA
jgi:2-succinyl-6-hydroxy-2,4-cyclohexadiene-1-carboxylate synthase